MWLWGANRDAEGMALFVGNLPAKCPISDIEILLGDFAAEVSMKFSNKNFIDGSSIHFCVLSVSSRKMGDKIVKALRHKKLGGEYLSIHEFNYRSYQNDRRLKPYSVLLNGGGEGDRRCADRRRQERLDTPHGVII